jgi:hypothetical protein
MATIARASLGLRPGVSNQRPAPATEAWRLGPSVIYRNRTIFPVVHDQEADTGDLVALDRALASGAAIVSEQGE